MACVTRKPGKCGAFTLQAPSCARASVASRQSSDSRERKPSEFLKSVIGRPVIVKLNSGVEYRGGEDGEAGVRGIGKLVWLLCALSYCARVPSAV